MPVGADGYLVMAYYDPAYNGVGGSEPWSFHDTAEQAVASAREALTHTSVSCASVSGPDDEPGGWDDQVTYVGQKMPTGSIREVGTFVSKEDV